MAGNRLDEKRKQVRKQAEKARTTNKLAPREVQQGNNMTGAFPFGGYSEDAQLSGRSTRQGGNYARQHMKEHSQAWEDEFRRRSRKK